MCCSVPAASVRIRCFLSWLAAWGLVCVLLFLHCWSARGLAFRLGVCLLGFPAVVCAVSPFPTISCLCNLIQQLLTALISPFCPFTCILSPAPLLIVTDHVTSGTSKSLSCNQLTGTKHSRWTFRVTDRDRSALIDRRQTTERRHAQKCFIYGGNDSLRTRGEAYPGP